MGITGLIPFLEKASRKCHLRDLRGQCVAIDSYCWLHKGAFACAEKLVRGEATDVHIQYCLKFVNLLLANEIKPILVFDGRHLPAKAGTEAKRRESRDSSKKRAAELLRMGKVEEAKSFLRRCVDITHSMALELIKECRKRNVDCVVAPYEADAQLAFLNKKGIAQVVITEDSDLMLFGCSKVLFKLDLTGSGLLIEREKLAVAMGCKEEKFTFDKFRYMCILSGVIIWTRFRGLGCQGEEVCTDNGGHGYSKGAGQDSGLQVSEEYKDSFLKADATFRHMVVYDPTERKQTRLNDPEEVGTDPELCCNAGTFLEDKIALQLALGNVDPFSMKQLDNFHPDDPGCQPTGGKTSSWNQSSVTKHASVWKTNYVPRPAAPDKRQNFATQTSQKPKEFIKRPVPNPDFEEGEKNETIDDVLHAYGIKPKDDPPPLKRLCLTLSTDKRTKPVNFDEVEALDASPSKTKRNPFVVNSTSSNRRSTPADQLLSPTKLTPETSSLLRNVSPVKRIEFKPTEKLSRFKRTVFANEGQKIISRFFSAGAVNTSVSPKTAPTTPKKASSPLKQETNLYLMSPEAKLAHRGEQTPTKKRKSSERTEISDSPNPPCKVEPAVEQVDSGFVEEPETGFSSSQKENEDEQKGTSSRLALDFGRKEPSRFGRESAGQNEDVGVVKMEEQDDDDVVEIVETNEVKTELAVVSSQTMRSSAAETKAGSSSQQKKNVACRRVGLAKGKAVMDTGPTQSGTTKKSAKSEVVVWERGPLNLQIARFVIFSCDLGRVVRASLKLCYKVKRNVDS
ncbi:exonuclease [Culex quinquefasciatus]|uniref:Exonuclease 1 n=3 Tax=Culex pipiens complex TaxID=518105 RepID=B0W3C7_CULQU|nr:exonuclease [Culex quinquefasciatus]|eukprot:XP_001843211.1 exonuclease [Culex quinquefasciatus]